MNVRHVAPIRPTQNSTNRHHARRRLVPAEHEVHSAYQVHQQVAGEPSTVFLPAAPARKNLRVKRAFRYRSLPGVPIDRGWTSVGWRRIFPRTAGIVSSERAFDQI